ncbi:hypothetical protein TNCV_818311 [Trichonephila clavipes]|nr:hypothetical protein TNCV_818311 [Trichonephila clavipes]
MDTQAENWVSTSHLESSQVTESPVEKKKVVHSNRRTTVLQIAENLNQETTVDVSEQTVCHTLHRIVYGSQRPVRIFLPSALKKKTSPVRKETPIIFIFKIVFICSCGKLQSFLE